MIIRQAEINELDRIKEIADANKDSIGFVVRTALKESIVRRRLLIAIVNNEIVGFAHYRHLIRESQTTLYEICVQEGSRRQGVGRALIQYLRTESEALWKSKILAKVPINPDGDDANDFYAKLGFDRVRMEDGKVRALNVYELNIPLPIPVPHD